VGAGGIIKLVVLFLPDFKLLTMTFPPLLATPTPRAKEETGPVVVADLEEMDKVLLSDDLFGSVVVAVVPTLFK
jgi:hypothetical protein